MLIQQSKFGSYVGGYDGGTNLTAVTSLEAKIGKLDILSSFDSWGADLLNANTLAVRSAAASR